MRWHLWQVTVTGNGERGPLIQCLFVHHQACDISQSLSHRGQDLKPFNIHVAPVEQLASSKPDAFHQPRNSPQAGSFRSFLVALFLTNLQPNQCSRHVKTYLHRYSIEYRPEQPQSRNPVDLVQEPNLRSTSRCIRLLDSRRY